MPPRVRATVDDTPPAEVGSPAQTETPAMCAEHFPLGWRSAAIVQANERLGIVQPVVFCEHGTYTSPVEATAEDAAKDDELAKLRARVAELEAAAPKAETPEA